MPYDEDKQSTEWIDVKGDMKECNLCKKSFKMGEHPDKPGKKQLLNPDGSKHQKFKKLGVGADGKNIWKSPPTCTSSKADWSQKKWEGESKTFNQEPELTGDQLLQKITELSGIKSDVIGIYLTQGGDTAWFTLAKWAGHKMVCEKVGITNPITQAFLMKVGEKVD